VADILRWICAGALKIGYRIVFILILLAILDFIYQRWEHIQSMKMTKQEVKEEHRQARRRSTGKIQNPLLAIENGAAPHDENVHKADVVITNPTEIAIALQYDSQTMSAPQVLAKGKRLLAQRIRQIALENDIPLVENKPLAQALYKAVDIGQEIPGNFYQAVAEILAYVYRLKGKF